MLVVKKYILTIWVLLITLIFSWCGMLISNIILYDGNNDKDVSAADLVISTPEQLIAFANNVNMTETYLNKTVEKKQTV